MRRGGPCTVWCKGHQPMLRLIHARRRAAEFQNNSTLPLLVPRYPAVNTLGLPSSRQGGVVATEPRGCLGLGEFEHHADGAPNIVRPGISGMVVNPVYLADADRH